MTDTFDLIVAGGGLAGMTAASAAARRGARVLVLEKSPAIGGSSLLSGANVWTAKDPELLVEQCPQGDPELIRYVCDSYPTLLEYFESFGTEIGPETEILRYGLGHHVD